MQPVVERAPLLVEVSMICHVLFKMCAGVGSIYEAHRRRQFFHLVKNSFSLSPGGFKGNRFTAGIICIFSRGLKQMEELVVSVP